MSAFYDRMAQTALTLIRDKGQTLTMRREAATGSDMVAGTVTTGAPNSGPVEAVVLPASKGTVEAFDNRVQSDSRVLMRLRFVVMAAKGAPFAPEPGDILEYEGADWQILGATPVSPAGTPLIYRMGIEKK